MLVGVDNQPAFRSTEGNIDNGALVGHERGQRLDFVLIDPRGEPDPSLDRQAMVAVYSTPPGEDLVMPIVKLHRKPHLKYRVTGDD